MRQEYRNIYQSQKQEKDLNAKYTEICKDSQRIFGKPLRIFANLCALCV